MTRLPDARFWQNRSVFVTGHQGFKGSWMTALLSHLGATTVGYGKDDRPSLLYHELDVPRHRNLVGDVTDGRALASALAESGAEILFHLAAQPVVLTSYEDPLGTFRSNVMGTAEVLEAARHVPSLQAVVVVTSDKVYRNKEWAWAYRESDPLGGHDPYSASKAAAEMLVHAMRESFFLRSDGPRVATARAGNVIGGGDWADFRLLPDAARALSRGQPLIVRNPHSTRPWQHVLGPLVGYLLLAEELVSGGAVQSDAWNYGPPVEDAIPVGQVAEIFVKGWGGEARWELDDAPAGHPEDTLLSLDSSLVRQGIGWAPRWRVEEAVTRTAAWYRDYFAGVPAQALVGRDIEAYLSDPGPERVEEPGRDRYVVA